MVGRVISHYRIVEQIGAGGMGVVYRAEDTRLGRALALKFLPADSSRDQLALDRFEREARTASTLNHPGICTIYDIGEFEGHQFIAMEFLEGQPLDRFIGGKPLSIRTLLDLGIQIADALDGAHVHGILHRDIKPANIFITKRGQAKVLDFGLAKLAVGGRGSASATTMAESLLTTGGLAVGTVAYMSPEQARGEDLDQRSDLFSFGVVLHEMATGRQAFAGNTTAVVFDAILNRMPPPVAALNPEVPADLERIIDKALEKERTMRYQTAADLKADLQRLKRDRDSSGRVSLSTPGVPPVQSRADVPAASSAGQQAASGTSAAPASAPGVQPIVPPVVPSAPPPRAAAPVAVRRPGTPLLLGLLALVLAAGAVAAFFMLRTSAPPAEPPAEASVAPALASSSIPSTPSMAPTVDKPAPPALPAPGSASVAPPAGAPGSNPRPGSGSREAEAARRRAAGTRPPGTEVAPPPSAPEPPPPPPAPEVDPVARAVEATAPAIAAGQLDQALGELQAALGQKPDSKSAAQANLIIARIYDRQRRLDAAMAAYSTVRTRYPRDPASAEALLRMADLVQQTKQPDRVRVARANLDEVVNDFPTSSAAPRALAARAVIEDRENIRVTDSTLGRPVPASLVSYRQLVERYPSAAASEGALWRLAQLYDDLKRHDLAAQALVDLGTRFPGTRHDAWWKAGELFDKRLKDKDRARDAYSKVPPSSRRYKDAQKKVRG
jgi:serine/threonine protein kinase/outer membrane protein assembly factor BamD (BamD/ComL family)